MDKQHLLSLSLEDLLVNLFLHDCENKVNSDDFSYEYGIDNSVKFKLSPLGNGLVGGGGVFRCDEGELILL